MVWPERREHDAGQSNTFFASWEIRLCFTIQVFFSFRCFFKESGLASQQDHDRKLLCGRLARGFVLGCSWAGPGLLLGCSWAAPGLVLGCSWAAPGCSWPAPGGSQAAPGLLPAALGLLLGFSWLLLDCSWLLLAACGCSWAAPGLLSQKHEQPATTNNLRQFGLLRWGVRVVVSTRRSERWVRLHTIASISSRDLVLGVSAERGVPQAVRAGIASEKCRESGRRRSRPVSV